MARGSNLPDNFHSLPFPERQKILQEQARRELGISDDEMPALMSRVEEVSAPVVTRKARQQENTKARKALGAGNKPIAPKSGPPKPMVPEDDESPLTPRALGALARFGYRGHTTFGGAIGFVRSQAKLFGLPVGGSKKITSSGTVTNEAELVRAMTAPQGAKMSGPEAQLLDELETLHKGIRSQMTTPYSTKLPPTVDVRAGRDPSTAATPQSIESESLDVTPEMREERASSEPPAPRMTRRQMLKKATESYEKTHGPMVSLGPAKNQRELKKRQKMIDAMHTAPKPTAPSSVAYFSPSVTPSSPPPAPPADPLSQAGEMMTRMGQAAGQYLKKYSEKKYQESGGRLPVGYTGMGKSVFTLEGQLREDKPKAPSSRNQHFEAGHSGHLLGIHQWMMNED